MGEMVKGLIIYTDDKYDEIGLIIMTTITMMMHMTKKMKS